MDATKTVKYRRGDAKVCVVCGGTFAVKHPQWCETCSRRCGAVLRNNRTKIVRWVKNMQHRVQQYCASHAYACKQCNQPKARKNQRCEKCKRLISDQSVARIRQTVEELWKRRQRQCVDCKAAARFWGSRCHECSANRKREMKRHERHLRRAFMKGATNGVRVLLSDIIKRDGMACHWCKKQTSRIHTGRTKATIDHVIALADGGEHSMENCVVACSQCNSRKGKRRYTLF